jgi:O-antigen/teichoic acid export membrane protein
MFLLADELVVLLYGTKWAAAGSLLRILTLIGFWRGLLQVVVPLVVSLNGPRLEARAKLIEALIFLATLYPLTRSFGAEGAAYAGVLVYLLTMVNRFRLIKPLAPQAFEKLPRIVSTTLGAGSLAIIIGALALNHTDALSTRLLFGGVVPPGVAVGLMLWMHPDLRRELRHILARRRL